MAGALIAGRADRYRIARPIAFAGSLQCGEEGRGPAGAVDLHADDPGCDEGHRTC